MKKLLKIYHKFWPWILITVGCVLSALGYTMLIIPLNMIEGGVTGIGFIMHYLTGLPIIGVTSIAITLVILVFAMRLLGKSFGAKAIYAIFLSNVLIDVFQLIKIPEATTDTMLASFYGGAIVGLGLGLVYYAGAATGGADVIAQLLYHIKGIPMGRTLIVIDIIVLGVALLIVGAEKIMYSFIFIFIEIRVVDLVLTGIRASQKIIIISPKHKEITEDILKEMGRGVTLYPVVGGFTGDHKHALTTVIPRRNIADLRRLVLKHDPAAFVIIADVNQVYGEGFQPLPREKF